MDDLVASIRKSYANRSPRAIARDDRSREARQAREATPERDRIIANMQHPFAHYKVIMDRQMVLAHKDKLTEDDKDALSQTHIDMADCPYLQPAEIKAGFMLEGIGPEHYRTHLQDWLWDILWAADYRGDTLEAYMARVESWGPVTLAALKASPPVPEGYILSTRR